MHISTLGAFLEEAEHLMMDAELCFGHGTDNAWDEAVALASYVLHLPPDVDASVMERSLSSEEKNTLMGLLERRINDKIPMPYLTHTAWFFGLPFYVDERVIIPRSPLAELIEHQFQPWLGARSPKHHILDLCTGSACIAIACAYAFENAQVDAVDISELALQVAQKNVETHQKEKQVNLILGDLFVGCQWPYDLIISNPPYVSEQEYQALPEEYHYEPKLALETGNNGLAIVNRILKEAPHYLAPKGILVVEVGNSADAVMEAYPDIPFTWLNFERGGDGVFLLELGEDKRWKS